MIVTDYKLDLIDVSHCNLCGESVNNSTLMGNVDRYGFTVNPVVCNNCGLIYLSRMLSDHGAAEFYEHIYRPLLTHHKGHPVNADTIEAEQYEYARRLIGFLDPCPAGGFLLDIGGSTGVVAQQVATAFSMGAIVIDPSTDEVVNCQNRGVLAFNHSIEEISFAGDIGLTLMCRTVDHLQDISGTFERLREIINGGQFFVDALDWMRTREFKIDHPYNLTLPTMINYLHGAGFDIIKRDRVGNHIRFLCR